MTTAERLARTEQADRLCSGAFAAAIGEPEPVAGESAGVALVAVGGYGRRELAPCSDLDVVLVHEPGVEVGGLAEQVWYPVWDANVTLDHSVRALDEVTEAAAADVRVALGLLDTRHLAGDTAISLRLRADVLARWRRDARDNLPRLRELVQERADRVGELAHAAVPDLKDSIGGLRDATVLKALVATWLVDVPHTDLERCRLQLLDVRDLLQAHHGRASDRVGPESWASLAGGLAPADEQPAQRRLREIGRRTAHLAEVTWRRVDRLLAEPVSGAARAPRLEPVARGVALADGEVVLDREADPATDPALLLRAAVAAAERGITLSPPTAARLAQDSHPLPEPWPASARELFVRLLASGPGLVPVWETLDQTGALDRMLPEWERIRLLPHASVVHRFTVDRHAVETCVEASRLIRRVARPDLLLIAALLHDIGKGGLVDHSVAGEPIARKIADRVGFDPDDVATVGRLVRDHLLLATTATTRDLDDPATVTAVVEEIGDTPTLELLEVLTEADARATSPKAWTRWRAGLITELGSRSRAALAPGARLPVADPHVEVPEEARRDPSYVAVGIEPAADGTRIRVVAADRVGLMADVSGTLAGLRLPVRSARAWTVSGTSATEHAVALSEWEVDEEHVDRAVVAQQLESVLSGGRAGGRSRRPVVLGGPLPPSVLAHHEASDDATVLEVRTQDASGVLHVVCRALAGLELSVRSAHVTTVGPQALDVFYVQEAGALALSDPRAADAVHAVRAALEHAATLD